MGLFSDLLKTASKGEQKASKEFELIGNCFGFYGLSGGVGTSTLAFEVALAASQQNVQTCFIDCSPLSAFAFSKATKFIKDTNNIPTIANRFIKRTCPIANTLIPITETLRIMTFGDMALSDTFSMSYDILYETYKEAKEVFDLVIMDIQHLPWCESTIAAVQNCSTVYTLCAPTPEVVIKKTQYDNLMSIAGLSQCFRNIVFAGVPNDLSVVKALGNLLSGTVVGEYAYVSDFKRANLSELSVLGACKGSDVRKYAAFTDTILSDIFEGLSGKEG